MTFNHLNIVVPQVAKQITQDGTGKRLYQVPDGQIYPSITTVLEPLKREILEKWRERVGDDVADAESRWGRDRGSALHLACEDLIENKLICGHPMLIRMLIEDLMPYILRINNVHCQETVLYSNKFRIAGRVDLIAEYNGLLSIIDFKGSKRSKKREWITDYFMQTAFYAYAYWERTGYKVQQCVVLMANEQGPAQDYVENPWDWWSELKRVRKQYYEENGI
jgi:genome maintenance exonuclease 1